MHTLSNTIFKSVNEAFLEHTKKKLLNESESILLFLPCGKKIKFPCPKVLESGKNFLPCIEECRFCLVMPLDKIEHESKKKLASK